MRLLWGAKESGEDRGKPSSDNNCKLIASQSIRSAGGSAVKGQRSEQDCSLEPEGELVRTADAGRCKRE